MELWNLGSGFQLLAGFQTADCWIPDSKAQDFTSYKQHFPYMGQVRARAPHLAIFYNKKNLEVLWIRVPSKIRSKAMVRSPSFTALKLKKRSSARAPRMSIRFRTLAHGFNSILTHWTTSYMYYRRGRRKHTSAWKCIFRWTFWLVPLDHKFVRVEYVLSLSRIPLSLSHLVGMPEHPTIK